MQTKDAIRTTFQISSMVQKAYLADLADADLMRRPGPGCNHVAWQLGHLIKSEASLLDAIQPGTAPQLPDGFADKHGSQPEIVASDNPADFYSKQEYQELTEQVHTAFLQLLETYPDEKFDDPAPEFLRALVPTIGAMFVLIATHPLMHAGQIVPVRRALGKPVVI